MAENVVEAIRNWQAVDWADLRETWGQLLPREGAPPRFRSEALNLQQAGWLFERLVMDAFRLDHATGHYPYSASKGEQIDGLLVDGRQGFLVESKFKKKPIGIDPIYRLHALVEHRPVGTLGLFFSASGYTRGAKKSAGYLRPIRVLLFQPVDLEWAFQVEGRMMAMVRRKWAFALKYGRPDMPITKRDANERPATVPLELFGEGWDNAGTSGPTDQREPPGTTLSAGDLP